MQKNTENYLYGIIHNSLTKLIVQIYSHISKYITIWKFIFVLFVSISSFKLLHFPILSIPQNTPIVLKAFFQT